MIAGGARLQASQRGFTYIGLLFAIALLGLALAAVGTVWSTVARRDREQSALWIGQQYVLAIQRYYLQGPVGVRQFPQTIDELLEDRRGEAIARHLRRAYADPLAPGADWELIRLADGGIIGIRSSAPGRPLKITGFPPELANLDDAECYCDWEFTYTGAAAARPSLRGVRPDRSIL